MEPISTRFFNMSAREKALATLTVLTLLTYMTYMLTFQPLLLDIGTSEKRLSKYVQTRQNIENARGSLTKLGNELIRLKSDLAEKIILEAKLNNRLSSGGHTDSVLKSLEKSTRKLNLELLELKETSTTSQRTASLVIEKRPDKPFVKNRIVLKYRSSYPAGVEYLASISEIPYAISILSVEMTPLARAAGKPTLITTTIEMELFSK